MKRLLHVFSTFCCAGPQVRFASTANSLGGEFSHSIIAMDGNYDAVQRIAPDVSLVRLPAPPRGGSILGAVRLRKIIREHKPDLVITYNWGAMDAVIGGMLAGCCPIVHTEDGFNPDEGVRLKLRRVLARRLVLNHLYATVVPSHTLLAIARSKYRVRSEKVRLIPNGIDCRAFAPSRSIERRRQLGADNDTFLVGYVGHLRPEKNLSVLVKAFEVARLKNARLVFIGDGECRGSLGDLARGAGLADRIHFVGPTADPRPYLNAFDLFAMSSYTEQMPMSLLEAMASGLPVVCTGVGDCDRMLDSNAPPVIVPSGDVPAYAAALSTMAGDPALRHQIGEKNRARCLDQYSLQRMVSSYADLYRQATGHAQPHRASDLH